MPPTPAFEITDTGFIDVAIGDTKIEIDAFAVYNEVIEARDANADEDKPVRDFHERVVGILERVGFARVSHYAADRFVTALELAVDRLGKADGSGAKLGSPTTSEPTPSTAPAAGN